MTYIEYLNNFNQWLEEDSPTDRAVILYYALLNLFNRRGWPRWAGVDTQRLMVLSRTSSKPAALRARDALVSAGWIQYRPGKKGKATEYRLLGRDFQVQDEKYGVKIETKNVTESVTESVTENVTKNVTPNKTKTKKEKEDKEKAPAVTFPLKDGGCYPVSAEQCRRWAELYPAVDVEQQLRNMRGWLEANPQKRKTRAGILRFANGWLAREQNQGGQSRISPTGSQTPDYGREEDYW